MKALTRLMSLLLSLLLLSSLTVGAFAAEDEYESLDEYVLHHNVEGDDYDGPNLQYFSPYITDYTFDGSPSFIQNNIFSLYNTLNGEVIPTYCTDIQVGALPDHRYRRQNLEDSTYAANAAGELRAIMRKGFYLQAKSGETEAEHAVRVQSKLQELGTAAGVPDLTIGEAISGTQSAIWQAAHGSRLVYTDFVRTIYTGKVPSAVRYYDLCNEERENGHIDFTVSSYGQVNLAEESDVRINSRIQAVYDYLLSLQPIPATTETVSPASFISVQEATPSLNADGTYDVTVTTTVNVEMAPADYLTLTAMVDSTHFTSVALADGKQSQTLTISNVPADLAFEDVTLAIDGKQTVSEVFIFDAYGDRETAQTMIGMDDSQLPVHASIRAATSRVLNFYKTTPVATGTGTYEYRPLEGITFDIYFVASLSDYLSGNVLLPDAKDYDYPEMSDLVVITDAEGRATVNLTQYGMEDGVYLVVEREHPAIKKPVDPFYVTMPTTNADGTGYEYEVTIRPKNDVKGDVSIDKDVTSIGNNESAVDAYKNHTWIISTTIPGDISVGKSYVISDTLDSRLDYVGNVKVNVETADGTTVLTTLVEGVDYELTVTDVDSLAEEKPSDGLKVVLTSTGMSKIGATIGTGSYEEHRLRVYFDAQINANARAGEKIPNDATLNYTNSVNFDFEVKSDEPVVYTGGAELLKVDSTDHNQLLPGAVFEVYRKATAEEVMSGADNLTHIDGVSAAVVKVSFFDNAGLTGEKVTSVTSDEKGQAAIYGLAYGTYYLLETQSPGGYNLLPGAVELTVDASTHMEGQRVIIENVAGSALPETGGIGTTVYTMTGLLLVGASVLLLAKKKRQTV